MKQRLIFIGVSLFVLVLAFQNCSDSSIAKRSSSRSSVKEVKQLEVDPTPTPAPTPRPTPTPTAEPTPTPMPQKGMFDDLVNFSLMSVSRLSIHDDQLGDITVHLTNSNPTMFSIGNASCLQNIALEPELQVLFSQLFSNNGLFDENRLKPFMNDLSYIELIVHYSNGSAETLRIPATIFPATYPEDNIVALLITQQCLSFEGEDISAELPPFATDEIKRLLGDLLSSL